MTSTHGLTSHKFSDYSEDEARAQLRRIPSKQHSVEDVKQISTPFLMRQELLNISINTVLRYGEYISLNIMECLLISTTRNFL